MGINALENRKRAELINNQKLWAVPSQKFTIDKQLADLIKTWEEKTLIQKRKKRGRVRGGGREKEWVEREGGIASVQKTVSKE